MGCSHSTMLGCLDILGVGGQGSVSKTGQRRGEYQHDSKGMRGLGRVLGRSRARARVYDRARFVL